MTISAVVVAGGLGRRMKNSIPKQFLKLGNKPIITHTIEKIVSIPLINEIIAVLPETDFELRAHELKKTLPHVSFKAIVKGGKERQDSVLNGFQSCSTKSSIIIIHDAVRPFFDPKAINNGVAMIKENICDGVIYAIPVTDTIKLTGKNEFIIRTVERENLFRAQTPQIFKKSILDKAFKNAYSKKLYFTDDAAMIEAIKGKIRIIEGSETNIKITSEKDLKIAEYLLKQNLI